MTNRQAPAEYSQTASFMKRETRWAYLNLKKDLKSRHDRSSGQRDNFNQKKEKKEYIHEIYLYDQAFCLKAISPGETQQNTQMGFRPTTN